MTASHWRKESVNIINDRTCACATDGPVLIVLIYNKYEWLEVVERTVSQGTLAFSAVHRSDLFWSSGPALNGEVDVVFGLEDVQF